MKRKPRVTGSVRVKAWPVLMDALERGLRNGYRRAFKHTDKPNEEAIISAQFDALQLEISEVFAFDDESEG